MRTPLPHTRSPLPSLWIAAGVIFSPALDQPTYAQPHEAQPHEAQPHEARPQSGLQGSVVDRTNNQGLGHAPVIAQPQGPQAPSAQETSSQETSSQESNTRATQTYTVITEPDGTYRLVAPPGRYTLRAYNDGHREARIPGVRIRPGEFTSLTLRLTPLDEGDVHVEEVEVFYRADTSTRAAQDQLRRQSSGIGEGVGSEQMSQQGASDAGSAASRVAGVSMQGSQLIVRGLGGRYNRVLLNGVAVPSTDPDVPGVDLDLFPTSVIDSLNLSKAFLPNLPGDFSGGLLNIHTVTFPQEFTLKTGTTLGFNSLSTFRSRLNYEGGSLDALGFDDGTRAIPNGIPDQRVKISRHGPYQSFEAIEAAGELFENTWQYQRTTALPRMGLGLTVGDSKTFSGQKRLGYMATLGYDYNSIREVGISRPRPTLTEDGSLATFNDYKLERGIDEAQLGALATTSLDLGTEHSITALGMFNQTMSDETQVQSGVNGELATGEQIERWQLQFLTRTLAFGQLLGDHRNLGNTRLRLRWSGFAAAARRAEPDRRSVTYGSQGGQFRWLEKANSGERFFSDLNQTDLGATFDLRFPLWAEAWGTVGGRTRTSGRDFLNRRFRFLQDPRNTDQSLYQAPVEDLFSENAIGTLTRIREFTRPNDSYTSRQTLYAGFAMIETPITGGLFTSTGIRTEVFEQNVQSKSPFSSESVATDPETSRTSSTNVDVLPAVALKYDIKDSMVIRATYGATVGRAQIRELAPYQYYDFLRDRNVQGNPDLERTRIHNMDLRWEWFLGEGEIFAVTGFYKYFINPIELQILNPDNYDAQFINARSARNVGTELELRLSLRRVHDTLKNITLDTNLALISSKVQLPRALSGAVQDNRALFGTSPYVLNLLLRYHDPETRASLAMAYNVAGAQITDVGTRVNDTILPHIKKQPFHSLDLVAGWDTSEHTQLKLKLNNLLFDTRDYRQGNFLTQRIHPGASASISFSYDY